MVINNPIKMTSLLHASSGKMLPRLLIGVMTLGLASQLSIPLQPVPLTFQSVTVIMMGMMFGARYGSYILLMYLLAGALGLPVYANFSAGLTKLIGPTGGYLFAFPLAAFVSGWLAENGFANTVGKSFLIALLGASIIFIFGVTWLSFFVGMSNAIQFGLIPFIISEPIKLLVLAFFVPFCWKRK